MFQIFGNKNTELEEKIAELEAKIASLEKEVSSLKNIPAAKEDPNEKYIQTVMKEANWDRKTAVSQIKAAKARIGISCKDYARYGFHRIPEAEQKAEFDKILAKRSKKKDERAHDKEAAISGVMAATGWNRETTVEKIMEARKRTGCAYKEYLIYKFYELDEQTQNELFLMKLSKELAAKYDVSKEYNKIFCNKELTNKRFSEYLKRPWCVNTKISFKDFQKEFANSKRIIYKPLDGNRGKGVEGYDLTADNMKAVYDELVTFPAGVVEEYVVQHPKMSALAPSSVNTVRVVTLSSYSKPVTPDGKHMDIAYASLRICGGTSIVDNFHSGGMCAVVDLETGKLVTDAADMSGHTYSAHPVTGVTIKGFQIPHFHEILQMVTEACDKNKIDGYLGWDIAITENGPVLIEINLRPGVVLLTTPYIAERKGMKHVMEKYL